MNVPAMRTAAQRVPPAAVGVGGTLPAIGDLRASGASLMTAGRNPVLAPVSPQPDPPPRHVECCLVTQQGTAGNEGTAPAPVPAPAPLLSLISLPFTDIVLVCAHTHTHA